MSRVRRTLAACAILSLITVPALAGSTIVVSQKDRAFMTREVHIHVGDSVRFTDDDEFAHQVFVSAPTFAYESDEQEPGQTVVVTFRRPGTFDVQCRIHPKMHLRVVVR
ncbi:cupredoxin domain-containing protein [Lichenicoccus sp.]|uniref:cupredoxin domain-containing protein n=1 Tax=Lichenicoccus sp. TaxID=2781899 RepID=UPI003D0B2E08